MQYNATCGMVQREAKKGKSGGPDGIHTEMLAALEQFGVEVVWILLTKI